MSLHSESLVDWVPSREVSLFCTIKSGEREGSPFAQHSGKTNVSSSPVNIISAGKFRDLAQHSASPQSPACSCSSVEGRCQPDGAGTGLCRAPSCSKDEGTIRDGVSRLYRAQSRAQAHSSCGAADPSGAPDALGASVYGCARSLSALAVASMLSASDLDNLCNALSSPYLPPHASLAAAHAATPPPGAAGLSATSAAAFEAAANAAALAAFSLSLAAPADSPRSQQQLLGAAQLLGAGGPAAADGSRLAHAALLALRERLDEHRPAAVGLAAACAAVAAPPPPARTLAAMAAAASGSALGDVGRARRMLAGPVRCTLDGVPPRRGLYEGTVRGGSPRNSWIPCAAAGS